MCAAHVLVLNTILFSLLIPQLAFYFITIITPITFETTDLGFGKLGIGDAVIAHLLGPLLLTWLTLIPAWISNYIHYYMGWNFLSIPKLHWLHHWSLEMDK